MRALRRLAAVGICAAVVGLGAPAAKAAFDPTFVFPAATPAGQLDGLCGVAVDGAGNFYLSDHYGDAIAVFTSARTYQNRFARPDPLNGPCGLAVDNGGRLYVNDYHQDVEKITLAPFPYNANTVFTPVGVVDPSKPTGVAVDPATGAVYVDVRGQISVYDSAGAPQAPIGAPSVEDGYGVAVSQFPATLGRVYVPDHDTDTVKAYDPLIDPDDPAQVITGPPGGFGSLRDSAVAVDRVTGDVYVADTRGPQFSERPEATIHVFSAAGAHEGRLKYNMIDGSPVGLAVDNSTKLTQGRVYVTSGNGTQASVYAYPPGSATSEALPALFSLGLKASGEGSIAASLAGVECSGTCTEQIRSGTELTLTATPDPGSAFTGWSGAGCSGTGTCTVTMSEARSVSAEFPELSGPPVPVASGASSSSPAGHAPRASASAITQKGTLRVDVSGKMAPKRLPREGAAPISVSVGGEISTTDKSPPPQLKRMRIELNKEGRLDAEGLPVCVYDAIQPGSSSRALSACRSSQVGEGSFTADITLSGQEPYPTKGKLLVFNGKEKGKPVLYGHIYAPKPFATSFVIVFRVQRLGKGTYGTALDAPLPAAMDAWGRLTSLQMTLQHRYSHNGTAHSFLSAGCPAPRGFTAAVFPLARTEFSFDGGKKLRSTLMSQCRVRG